MSSSTEARPPGAGAGHTEDDGHVTNSLRRYPTAWAKVYAPTGRRTRWWAAISCPHCGGVHLARLRARSDLPGVRRSGCGQLVWVVPS